jgi:hypothetical protein
MKTPVVSLYLSMFAKRFCKAAIFLACLTTAAMAQETAGMPMADARIYRVGDRWTIMYGKTAIAETVVSVTEEQTTITESKNGGAPYEAVFDSQGCLTRSGNTTYEPSLGSLSFPMMVGKSWDSHWVVRNSSGSHENDAHMRVEAFERIEVAAGSFDAFKIAMRGISVWTQTGLSQAPWTATYWYAPSVKRVVKSEYSQIRWGGSADFEMSAFSLAP